MGVREAADGIKQGFGLGDTPTEERLALSRRADGSPELLETGCEEVQGGMTSVSSRLTSRPTWWRPVTSDVRKQRTAGASPAQRPSRTTDQCLQGGTPG